MRLHSAEAYDEALTQVRQAIDVASGAYTLDLSQVVFLNSSGIRGPVRADSLRSLQVRARLSVNPNARKSRRPVATVKMPARAAQCKPM